VRKCLGPRGKANERLHKAKRGETERVEKYVSAAPPTQDHEIVRIGDEANAETLLKAELLPPQSLRVRSARFTLGSIGTPESPTEATNCYFQRANLR
jgi:hypothetical protein